MGDVAALKLAVEVASRDTERAGQLQKKLRDEPWGAVAKFAAYCCQCDALSLKPWESPPCVVSEDESDPSGVLLRKMLAAGVSRYDPDPMAALEKKKKRKRRA